MKKMVLFFVLSLFCFILTGVIYFYEREVEGDSRAWINAYHDSRDSIDFAKELQIWWKNGLPKVFWEETKEFCSSEFPLDLTLNSTRCSPHFFNCFLRWQNKAKSSVIKSHRKMNVEVMPWKKNKYLKYVVRSVTSGELIPDYAYSLKISKNKRPILTVLLLDTCRDSYLPKRNYGRGQYAGLNDWTWNNLDKNIYIDKYPVSFYEIKQWIESDVNHSSEFFTGIVIPKEKSGLWETATGLTGIQMESYCRSIGRELLSSDVFDAASFHSTLKEEDSFSIKKSVKRTHLLDFTSDDLNSRCKKIYTKECLKTQVLHRFSLMAPSWMGIYHAYGSYIEAMKDYSFDLNTPYSLKMSSYFFEKESKYHQLGVRSPWSGEDPAVENGDIKYAITFRCMKRP